MLSYLLNGIPLVLNEETSFRLSVLNPVTQLNEIKGDAGIGVTIPVNEHNRAILGNPERLEKSSASVTRKFMDFEIRFDGVLLLKGALIIKNASGGNYEGWVQNLLGVMKEEQQEKDITELDWPTGKLFDYNNSEPYDDAVNDYAVDIIHNPGFWEGRGKEEQVPVSYKDEYGVWQEKEETRTAMQQTHFDNYAWYVNNHTLPTVNPGCVVSPFLYLRYVIRESLRLNKWFIGRNDMDDALGLSLQKNLKLYNNFNIIDFNPVTALVEDFTWDPSINEMVSIGFQEITTFNWQLSSFDYRNLLPKVKLKAFYLGIQNNLNYVFHFRNDGRVNIIDRNGIFDRPVIDISAYQVGQWKKGEKKDVTLKFISEFDKNDGLFDNEYEDLTDRRNDFEEAVDTYAHLLAVASPAIGELRYVREQNKVYEYKWKVEIIYDYYLQEVQHDALGWEFVSSGPQPFLYGTGAEIEEIKTIFSTLQNSYFPEHLLLQIPEARQKGNLASTRSVYNDFSPRLIVGNQFLWPNGLKMEPQFGLFDTRWKKFARFWASCTPADGTFDMPVSAIAHIAENITEPFRTREGEFIIDELEVTFGLNAIGKTTLKVYKK